ncbi:MAG: hypothetical protein HRU40_14295, partial [Saprospiraceae bacterium]|nr:hypothetical protein [Saprospiraceae bacterium]
VVSNRGLSEIGTVPGKGNTNHDGFVEVSFLNNDKKTNYLYRVGANAIIDLDITSVESSNALTVSMFGGAVYNRVITPPDESLGIVGFDRYTLGYGGGVNLGFEMGRLEVGSGFGYTAVRYEPIPLLVTRGFFNSGYTAEKFDFVELNVLSLPVYVQYSVFMDDRWRAYTNAGASLQVAYETNFYGVFPQDLPTGFARPRREESSFANRYGWFEGGSFRDNSFVTLNLGFGLERIFSKRTSLFIQPTYAHNLGYFSAGMGPTRDRIHSMSVYSGVRVRFRK